MQIEGKVFIVTGGASGLGEGTARMLAANGGKVVVADMQAEKGEAVAKEIGGVFVKCDVSQEADGQAAVAAALQLGKLVGLVNCEAAVGRAVNLGSTEQVSISQLAGQVIAATGSASGIKRSSYLEAYGSGYEDMQRRVPNCDLARELVGFTATRSLADIISAVIADQQSALAVQAAA